MWVMNRLNFWKKILFSENQTSPLSDNKCLLEQEDSNPSLDTWSKEPDLTYSSTKGFQWQLYYWNTSGNYLLSLNINLFLQMWNGLKMALWLMLQALPLTAMTPADWHLPAMNDRSSRNVQVPMTVQGFQEHYALFIIWE